MVYIKNIAKLSFNLRLLKEKDQNAGYIELTI